jgi:hypothetical protein
MGIDEPDIDPERFLEDIEMRVGEITSVEEFPEARKDVYKLDVDFGSETLQSAAGLTLYKKTSCSAGRSSRWSISELYKSRISRVSVSLLASIATAAWFISSQNAKSKTACTCVDFLV